MAGTVQADGPHPVDRHVGRRIAERRIGLGFNQSELGKALGLTFQQIQKYEKGANRVSASKLWEVARFLNVTVPYFYDGLEGADLAHGVSEDYAAFSHEPRTSRNSMEIARLARGLPISQQKVIVSLLGALRGSETEDF